MILTYMTYSKPFSGSSTILKAPAQTTIPAKGKVVNAEMQDTEEMKENI